MRAATDPIHTSQGQLGGDILLTKRRERVALELGLYSAEFTINKIMTLVV